MQKIRTFNDFIYKLQNLRSFPPTEDELREFVIYEQGDTRLYYAPFDWVNTSAKLVIVGITPGRSSMINALHAAASALQAGNSQEEASKRGRREGSFSNMRNTISQMFDELGLPKVLDIHRSEELFGSRYDLLHPTACIRHPVLVRRRKNSKWTNYSGHSPKLLKWEVAVRYIESVLAEELEQVPSALVVPCGKAVDEALKHLVSRGLLDRERCLFGFPHASGANGHRKKFFEERREELTRSVGEWARKYL